MGRELTLATTPTEAADIALSKGLHYREVVIDALKRAGVTLVTPAA